MATVYLVTKGEYSDYRVVGVFTTREKADAFIAKDFGIDKHEDHRIEELVLDPEARYLPEGRHVWVVQMFADGTTAGAWERDESIAEVGSCRFGGRGFDVLVTFVDATSKEHAVKVANERRAQLIATNQWGVNP